MDLLNKIDMFVGYDINNINEETEYQKFFKKKLKEHDVSSPVELDEESKKKFFSEIKKEWKGSTNESWYMTEESAYQKFFAKKMEEAGYTSISDMTEEEKKKFFDMIDREWKGESKNEGELPPALKKAIEAKKKKDGDNDEEKGESKEHEDSESEEEEKEEHKKNGKKDNADK